ncbi:tensin-2 isoform X2 [Tachysurus fulvidraco]|uniref:tensin-2 isoform X2 n=1 Tax=Tachysurus fulvidraco TaxID=1234273 RepID=UPI001FEF6C97|nr:tensin-2 isoform X2 [Tachysurus fulvidraco]
MGCIFSKQREVQEQVVHLTDGPQTRDCNEDAEILSLTEVGTQSFKGGKTEKKHHCSVCRQILDIDGACYRECKSAANSNRETKSSKSQSDAPLGSDSVENVMENIMESRYDFDLIYITERIISVFFLPDLDEQRYRRNLKEVAAMLKSKHQEKFLVINLSEKRHDICRLNPKVEEFGWPDLHAPPLDKICTVCKTMEGWLNSDPHNVVVLHCKGNRGKTGVIIAAYMHFSKISARIDHALNTVTMRKFCEDKISSSLQPSQNRYIYYFSGLLSGAIKINSSSLLLQQVHIPAITNYEPGEVYAPFLKIYQSLKLVYTSGIYETNGSMKQTLCIKIEPALLLKGDIMVKCYHRRSGVCERECVFRVQFHTCTVHGSQLWFGKKELDHACTDKHYPADATVELVFSGSPAQKRGEEIQKKDPKGSPHISCTDPVVRWDSYENFNFHHEDSIEDICHTRGPLDGSLYAQVKKRRIPGSVSNNPPVINSSTPSQLPNISSDTVRRSTRSELEESPLSSSHYLHQREDKERNGQRDKPNVRDKDRETAILDDNDCSRLRVERACCGRPYSHPHSYFNPDLSKTHPQKLQPKHYTLPCTRASALPVCEPCGSQPNFLWEKGHCQHHCTRSCYTYPSPETYSYTHSRSSHTLPVQTHLFCTGDAYPLLHYSPLAHNHTHIPPPQSSHQSLPSSPYHELRFSSTSPTSCNCRDCLRLREDLSHSLRGGQLEKLPLHREPGFGYRREGAVHWTRDGDMDSQDPDCWQHRTVMPPIMSSFGYGHRHCHSISKQDHPVGGADPRQDPSSSPYPSPHSSGYHSPHLPWPCSPPHIRDSPGYASMAQSPNSSPLAHTPSPKRTSLSQNYIQISNSGKEHNILSNLTEVSDKRSKMNIPQDVSTKEDGNNIVSLQVQNSEAPPVDTEELVNCDVAHRDSPSSSSTSSELTKEPQVSEAKNPEVTESTSTPILISKPSEPSQASEPQVTALEVESLLSVTQEQGNASLPPKNENISTCSSERNSLSELLLLGPISEKQSLTPPTDGVSFHEDGSNNDLRAPSPVPDGYITPLFPLASTNYPLLTVPHLPYTGYTAITIPSYPPQPPLPEKQRVSPFQDSSTSSSSVRSSLASSTSSFQFPITLLPTADTRQKGTREQETCVSAKFVQDTTKFWYKPGISRDQAIAVLKDKDPGYFLIRDSSSFQGAYGLALKVATPPAYVSSLGHTSHSQEQLVRHFLIESGAKGVKIKGCQNEMYFGSLSALVYQHSITPVSLPCKLHIPDKDLVGELQELQSDTNTSTAAELLKQGAACNVLYINSVDTESLTGPQAISRAVKCTRAQKPCPSATAVHFKVSSQGITLTDNQRRLFFRRHYPIHSVIFSCLAPEDQRMFGFVARRSGSSLGNVCHLFAELDPEQPATAIINFINKVMLGPHHIHK